MEEGNIKAEDMIASQGNEGKGLKKIVCVVIWAREVLAGWGHNTRLYKKRKYTIQEEESVSNSKLLSPEHVSMYSTFQSYMVFEGHSP